MTAESYFYLADLGAALSWRLSWRVSFGCAWDGCRSGSLHPPNQQMIHVIFWVTEIASAAVIVEMVMVGRSLPVAPCSTRELSEQLPETGRVEPDTLCRPSTLSLS
ncbi:hypothetical protein [Micromonospora radicis]|uniref:hypothetical protein n=1 Tax=Micromonospora radicis TaxID=1894971 RepID=UPI000E698825|nr:hypothetical protein [Micromonospora radicis]